MHLHLDCFSGIAGDMTLGALLDLGVPLGSLREAIASLGLDVRIEVESRDAGHCLHGLGVRVDEQGDGHDHGHDQHGHGHHDHGHDHDHHGHDHDHHGHDHDHHGHDHDHHGHGHHDHHVHEHGHDHGHRLYRDIRDMIAGAPLAPLVKERAQAVFARIAEAEARMHATPVEEVAFHEVGAADSITDIVGVAFALTHLGVTSISASPLPLGRGFTRSQHGRIPLPAPATLECLRGVPCYDSGLDFELVTPTGAAIVGALATEFVRFPTMTIARVGYGAGTRRLPDRPNLLRAVLGARPTPASAEHVWEIECNVDDQSSEELAWAMTQAQEAGAIDVWWTAVGMKKGRPGVRITALTAEGQRDAVVATLLRETTSLGVRLAKKDRVALARESLQVETELGAVRVKIGRGPDGAIWNLAPEADDCAAVAARSGVALKVVMEAARRAARERLG